MSFTEDTRPIATASILSKIRALLDRAEAGADDPALAAEAESCRAKAEHLMKTYRETQAARLAVDPVSATPEMLTVFVAPANSEFVNEYYWIMSYVVGHCDVKMHQTWGTDPLSGEYGVIAQLVGFEIDLRYAEMLFTAARIVFSEKLEPKVKPELSDQENAYRLRQAGIPRNRVANLLWGSDIGTPGAAFHAKVAKLYKAECEARGEAAKLSGRQVNAKTYREAYAEGFRRTFSVRLQNARDAAEGGTGAVSLAGRDAAVKEAFYTRFPQYRPAPAGTVVKGDGKAPKKSRRRGWTQADEDRWQRIQRSPGQAAGASAARQVELGRTAQGTTRVDPGADRPSIGG